MNLAHVTPPIDFLKLVSIRYSSYGAPSSMGPCEAYAWIEEYNTIALACKTNNNEQRFLLLVKINDEKLTVEANLNLRRGKINRIIWIEPKRYLITCSDDRNIHIISVSKKGARPRIFATLVDQECKVTCVSYIPLNGLLVTIGKDNDIKLWTGNNLKLAGIIYTDSNISSYNSIIYLPDKRLIGVGIAKRSIGLFHLYKRTLVLSISMEDNCLVHALHYLPKRKIIIAGVYSNDEIKRGKLNKRIDLEFCTVMCVVERDLDYTLANEDESKILFSYNTDLVRCRDLVENAIYNFGELFFKNIGAIVLSKGPKKQVVVFHAKGDRYCVFEQKG